jgi:Xaa-Pro aminopeptidase
MTKRQHLEKTLASALDKAGYEAVIAVSPENVQHLCGVFIASQRMIRDRLAFVVFRRQGAPFMVVSTVVAYTARTHSWIDDVATYREHAVRPIDGLVAALKDRGLEKARVLVETGGLPTRDGDQLRAALPQLLFDDAEKLLDRSRMVKVPEETEQTRRSARIWETAVLDGFKAVKENEPEQDISNRMKRNILLGGADWVPFAIFSSGEHTLLNHWVADASPVKRGDIMIVDMVGFFGGHYIDAARMAIIGEPSAAQRDAYRRMSTVQKQLVKLVKPGVVARDMFQAGVRIAKDLGMTFSGPDFGHSLGIRLHEYPILNTYEEEVIVPDMVMCIEVSQKFDGLGNFHVEDIVHVTPNGAQILTTLIDTTDMMVVG